MKVCNKCQIEKPLQEFFKDKDNKTDGHYSLCKECKMAATLAWRGKNRERYNATQRAFQKKACPQRRYGTEIKRRYGCTLEQYAAMLVAQKAKCALCETLHNPAEKKGRLFVDHCHKTGKVRALLCASCNSMLGYSKDNTEILKKAIDYLVNNK